MPRLSLKKILTVILVIVLLAYSRQIYEGTKDIRDWIIIGLAPLGDMPPEIRCVFTLMLLALAGVVLIRWVLHRGKQDSHEKD